MSIRVRYRDYEREKGGNEELDRKRKRERKKQGKEAKGERDNEIITL